MHALLMLIFFCLILFYSYDTAHASWLLYHKPAYSGRIVDYDSKESISNVVVVAIYNKRTMGLGSGTISSIIEVREVVSDRNGKFSIRSYTSIIQPFSWVSFCRFIVFKAGYIYVDDNGLEDYFSGNGKKVKDITISYNKMLQTRYLPSRTVEIKKIENQTERMDLPNTLELEREGFINRFPALKRNIKLQEESEKTNPPKNEFRPLTIIPMNQ